MERMLAAEKWCYKRHPDFLEWSPIVGVHGCHLHMYRLIFRYKNGWTVNAGNLKCSCESQSLPDPVHMTLEDVKLAKLACLSRLEELREQASQHQKEYLQACMDKARALNDEVKINALI